MSEPESGMTAAQMRRFGAHMNPYRPLTGGDGYKRDKAWQEGWDAAVTFAAVAWLAEPNLSEQRVPKSVP